MFDARSYTSLWRIPQSGWTGHLLACLCRTLSSMRAGQWAPRAELGIILFQIWLVDRTVITVQTVRAQGLVNRLAFQATQAASRSYCSVSIDRIDHLSVLTNLSRSRPSATASPSHASSRQPSRSFSCSALRSVRSFISIDQSEPPFPHI